MSFAFWSCLILGPYPWRLHECRAKALVCGPVFFRSTREVKDSAIIRSTLCFGTLYSVSAKAGLMGTFRWYPMFHNRWVIVNTVILFWSRRGIFEGLSSLHEPSLVYVIRKPEREAAAQFPTRAAISTVCWESFTEQFSSVRLKKLGHRLDTGYALQGWMVSYAIALWSPPPSPIWVP